MKLIIDISQEDYINIMSDKIYCPRNLTNFSGEERDVKISLLILMAKQK